MAVTKQNPYDPFGKNPLMNMVGKNKNNTYGPTKPVSVSETAGIEKLPAEKVHDQVIDSAMLNTALEKNNGAADSAQRTVEDTSSYKATKSENKSSGLNRDDDISVIYSDDGLIKAGKYGKAGKESYTRSEIDKMVESMYNSLKNPKSTNKTSQIRNLRFALDVYRAENGSLPAEYEKLYSQLRSIDTGKGDGTVIRNASSKEKAEVSKVKSVPIGKLVRFNTSNEVAASVEKIKRDYMSKSASELTAEDVGVLVINKIIDLDEIKKSEPSIYIDLVEKYKRHINSDNVSLTQNASLATDNTARNAWNAIEGVGRGVVNAGAALYNLGAQSESVDDFIEKNVVSDKLDDRLRYMPEGLRTATDIIGSSAQLIPTIALGSINPALGMALIGASSFGNSYSEALKDGASRSGAFWYGALNAVAELTIEKIAGGVPGLGKGLMTKTTSRIVNSFKRPAVQKLVRVGLEAGGEGMEELYTYLLEPVFKKVYDSDAKLDYSAEQAAYNFLGGFVGSAIFGGAAVAIGIDNDPAPGEIAKAQEAINKFKQSAFHNGISDIKTQKALKAAERAVKNVSYYIGENNTYNVPKEVAQMLSMSSGQLTVGDAGPYSATYSQGGFGELVRATDTVRRNPDSTESQELIDRYAGVGNTSVVRNDAYKKLVSDKKISRREAAAMDSLAYDFGANIEFVDNLTDEYGKPINGEYSEDGSTIRISTQSTDPFFATVLHESVHALRRGDSLSFYRLNAELKNLVGTNTSEFSKAYSTVKRSYARRMTGNKAADKNLIDEEFTSFMLSYLMDNPQTLKKIAQKNMNSVQKIVDTVLGWFDKSISRYENMDTRYQVNFADAVAKLRDKRDAFADFFGRASEGYYRSPISFDVTPDSTKKSIVTLPDGKKFVRASRQVIKGSTPEEWAQDVMHYINREIRHGRDVDFVGIDGDILTITRDTAGKARTRNSVQKKGGVHKIDTDEEFSLKLRVESHIDEIASVSKNTSRELTPDKKKHSFAKDGFSYRTAFFEDFDGQYYKIRISVGHNGDIKTIYNAGKIKLEGDPPGGSLAMQQNVAGVTPSNKLSIPHNQTFDNTNIDENASVDLEDVHSVDTPPDENSNADDNHYYKPYVKIDDKLYPKHRIGYKKSSNAPYSQYFGDRKLEFDDNPELFWSAPEKELLALAQRMEKDGVDIYDIWELTGWDKELDEWVYDPMEEHSYFNNTQKAKSIVDFLSVLDNIKEGQPDVIDDFELIEIARDEFYSRNQSYLFPKHEFLKEVLRIYRSPAERSYYEELNNIHQNFLYPDNHDISNENVIDETGDVHNSDTSSVSSADSFSSRRSLEVSESLESAEGLAFSVDTLSTADAVPLPHQGEGNKSVNDTALYVLEKARSRYGLDGVEDYGGVSFARADVDERLGREFQFEDNTVTSRVRDKLGNSLHLSDNVVFEYGERANVEYGTGRIVSIGEDGTVEIAVDSGNFRDSVVIPSRQITFVSHNDESTISEEIRTSHPMYESARNAYENYLRNQSSGIGVDANNIFPGFDFGKAQYYLFSSNNKLRAIEAALRKHTARDDGTNRSHYSNRYSEDAEAVDNPDAYDLMSANDLLIRYHEAVTNYNLAKEITDIYIRSGADVVDVDNMVMKLQDVDRILPGKKRTRAQKNKNSRYFKSGYGKNNVFRNGSYQFNDVYRNFQRVFHNHFDVVKPLLDNLDRAKGDYARNLMCNADVLLGMCSEYDFKPGDMFDMAIQWFGEKNIHFDLNNSKHRKLFGKLGYDEANFQYQDEFDVAFDYAQLEKLLGSERAAQAAECAGRFRAMYDDYLKRANDTISRIYPGQSDRLIKPRKDYFRHFSEMSDDLFSLGFALVDEKQIDPMLSGISNRTQPKQSFESYRQERKADNTDFSAVRGFVDYMQQAEYTININPFIKEFRELRQGLAHIKSQHGQSDLNSFLKYLDTYANHLAKKTTGFDRIFTDFLGSSGRTMLHGLELINGRVMKNAVIGNAATAVKQVLNLKNGIFYLQNPGLLANATLGLGKALTSDRWLLEHYNRLFEQSNYLAERFLNMNFANKRSGSRKIAENLISIGDEFSVRAIWLAAYEDAVKLDVPDPVVYADDIARRCSAGRGIGEKPLAFTQQVTKLFLPFLLENNNNWNVYRDFFVDTVQANVGDNHEFGDRNSYLYYKNQKTGASRVGGNSFKLAIFLLMTVGIGDLIEELTGSRPEFDPLNDFRKGFKNAVKDSGRFDFATFVDGLINSSKNLAYDFGEHRNFSSAYSAVASYLEDDPLRSNNDFFASVPAASTFGNVISRMVDNDWIGAGMEVGTGFLMPYGGGQLKKSIKGVADVAQGGHFVDPFTKSLLTEEKGGLMYEVKKSPGNYARGALFGSSALPEARKYWADREEEKRMSGDISDIEAEDFETYKAQFKKSKNKDASSRELWRLRNYTGSDSALPYHYFESDVSYKNRYGEDEVVSITEAERAKYQSELNDLLKKKYDEIVKSDKYKNSDDAGKVKLLSVEREKIVKSYNTKLESKFKNKGAFDAYVAAHGEDDIVKLIRKNGNDYSLLPVYDVYRNREFTLNNEERSFELTNEQIDKYSELTGQKISEEYAKVVAGKDWASLSDKQKAEKLKKAKDKAKSTVSDYVKWDYVYKDAMEAFDAELGEDNPVRRAYEYSHDATVYPFWDLNPTITFTYKKKSYSYTLSKEPNSYRDEVEYEVMSKAYSDRIKLNYVKNAIGGGYLKGKSDKEIYDTLMQYKSDIRTKVLNEELRNYAKAKLGLPY